MRHVTEANANYVKLSKLTNSYFDSKLVLNLGGSKKEKNFICRMKTGPRESGEASNDGIPAKLMISGVAILEFILRILAAAGTLGSAMAIGTTKETVPLFSQSILLNAEYSDLPMLTFFLIVNSVAFAYLVLSLPLSFYHIIRRAAKNSRIIIALVWGILFVSVLKIGKSMSDASTKLIS
ncbi:casparian strip membrane protein 3-like [Durio zibethinus]|uniref:CASP-like protein n=1 Tax=Durio zibethinus TaxID=66656 RepID=A0A6P6BFL8_DURZI|nr:casparian strip membrane protein 3-like [Durio zibethinus]